MLSNKKELFYTLFQVILGNIILAIGVGVFVLPQSILSGGLAGIAVALEPILHIAPDHFISIFTVILFLCGALFLGKRFLVNTAMSSILYPTFLTFISTQVDHIYITDNKLLASIYAGVCIGIGVGLVFRTGASTGGMDIPPLIINKLTGFPIHTLVMITDGLTVCLGILTYGLEAALIGLVSVYISGEMINRILVVGGHEAKNVMIISNKHTELLEAIYQEINRGVTILEATGGYTGDKRPVVMVVLSKKQFPTLNRIVAHVDPSAFVIVTDTNEVRGEGFTYEQEI